MTKWHWVGLGASILIVLLAVLGWLWFSRPLLPSDIRRQVSFAVFVPDTKSPAQLNRDSIKYDDGNKLLTYTANLGPAHLVVTNQATPDEFKDIPAAYDKVIESMRPYANFDSASGKSFLTKPERAGKEQVAVPLTMLELLMFVRANQDLTEDQWRKFFNTLDAAD